MRYCLFLLLCIGTCHLCAQKMVRVAGTVVDTMGEPLIAATVALLELPDSSFAEYGLTTELGKFQLTASVGKAYLFQVSYLGYKTYTQGLLLSQDTSLGTINLNEAVETLSSVQVTAERIPVRMRGDTLEFNSAAFHVQAHDDVEKLLRQLPGVEIDDKGTIFINGKKVTQVLVDGKEFFGDNAQAALKNLPADAIKKIEVSTPKKTNNGSENTEDEKTVDLKLKEEAKSGWLGNIMAGYGYNVPWSAKVEDNHRYKGSLSLNYFNPKLRATIVGGINNTNEAALAFQVQPYENNSPGITRTLSGGGNLNWYPSDKTTLSFSYMYQNNHATVNKSTLQSSILPYNFYTRTSYENQESLTQAHTAYMRFLHRFDSKQKLDIRIRGNYRALGYQKNRAEETLGEGDTLQNRINQYYRSGDYDGNAFLSVNYTKSFKKKNQELSFFGSVDVRHHPDSSYNNSLTSLYNNGGVLTEIDTLNQEQYTINGSQNYTGRLTYQHPLSDENRLEFRLIAGGNFTQNDRRAFDLEQQVLIQNPTLSDSYFKEYNHQSALVYFKRKVKAYVLSAGLGVKHSGLKGIIASSSDIVEQYYVFPTAYLRFRYFFTKSKKITFNYNTRFIEPKLRQLQPLVNNQNPLSVSIGNPNLLPEFRHYFRLQFNLWDQLTFTNFYVILYASLLQNSIIQSEYLDENFRTVYQPINSSLGTRAGLMLGYNVLIKKLKTKINFNGGMTVFQGPIMNNGVLSNQFNHDYNGKLTISNKNKEIVDVSVAAGVVVGNSIYESNSALNVTYVNHNYSAKFRVTIAKKWNLSTDFTYHIYANALQGGAIDVPILSASFYRTFFKSDALKVELSAKNLINEGIQVTRSSRNGLFSETQSNLLGRYFMLSITYNIKS